MIKRISILLLSVLAAFIAYQVIGSHKRANEIRQMVSRCPLIYLCEKRGAGEFVVSRVLKNSESVSAAQSAIVGRTMQLNRQRLGSDSNFPSLEVVVFVEPGSKYARGGVLNQSEIPIVDERLIPFPITKNELIEMIGAERK